MLPAAARLTRSQDFRLVVRRGRRAGRSRLVAHVLVPDSAQDAWSGGPRRSPETDTAPTREPTPWPRVGFVVSKAVGNAVVRHRVTRQLRSLVRERLFALRPGTLVVIRALPPAAGASSRELGTDLDAVFRKVRVLVPEAPST